LSGPLVTIGVPVYRGQDDLPVTLECLRTQTYQDLDVLISVDAGDQATAQACAPFLQSDSRFRMQIQPSRLGWAGNTDWTMRGRRGAFYIFQQHDDQVSPSYVADLVGAAERAPDAAICFAEIQYSGLRTMVQRGSPLLGTPIERATDYLHRLDTVPLRGLIRGSALASTSSLLLSDFDPFDSFGSELRLLAELALQGEFRFVPGPIYYKRMHGANLHLKREEWSEHERQLRWACLGAWMLEVLTPAGATPEQCRQLFDAVLARFFVPQIDRWRWLRTPARRLSFTQSRALHPLRAALDRLRSSRRIVESANTPWMLYEPASPGDRTALLRMILERLEAGGRFDPSGGLQSTWQALEAQAATRFGAR